MTTQERTERRSTSRLPIAPFIVAMIAALSFVAGLGLAKLSPGVPAQVPAVQAAATFDSVQFRAQERDSWQPAPSFDSVGFRAEERDSWRPAPTFDAVRFRAEERRP